MAAPKNLKGSAAREEHLAVVARMDRRGYTQYEIAKATGRTQQSIQYDLKQMHENVTKAYFRDHKKAIAVKLQQLYEIRAEAWAAWERSKQNVEKTVQEQALRDVVKQPQPKPKQIGVLPPEQAEQEEANAVLDGLNTMNGKMPKEQKLRVTKIIRSIEGRLPNNDYLLTIVKCLEQEAKLEGLFDEDVNIHITNQTNIQQTTNNLNVNVQWWDDLHRQKVLTANDPIEEKIQAIEAKVVETKFNEPFDAAREVG